MNIYTCTYRVGRNDRVIDASTVFVVIHGSEKDCNPGNLMIYAPIGQHGEASVTYIRYNTRRITKEQYIKASEGLYTPEEYLVERV